MPGLAKHREKYIETANDLLIRHAQWLLKEEWEKVKSESGGVLRRLFAYGASQRRLREYAAFCQSDLGRLTKVRDVKIEQPKKAL